MKAQKDGVWGKKKIFLLVFVICVLWSGIAFLLFSPRVYLAMSRAEDAMSRADLMHISGVLGVYQRENDSFPSSEGACLDHDSLVFVELNKYSKKGSLPVGISEENNEKLCSNNLGKYWYRSIAVEGVKNAGYILCADVEQYQTANAKGAMIIKGIKSVEDEAFTTALNIDLTEPTEDPGDSLYCVRN